MQYIRDFPFHIVYSPLLVALLTGDKETSATALHYHESVCFQCARTHTDTILSLGRKKAQTVLTCTHTFPNESSKIKQEAY